MSVGTAEAVRAAPALRGTLRLPSDKSIAQRALIFAALGAGESRLSLRHAGGDVRSTISALQQLGVEVGVDGHGDESNVRIQGVGSAGTLGRLPAGHADCGNSGTAMRLLAGAAASGAGTTTFVGDASLTARPMSRVADPLRTMGAEIDLADGHAPLTIHGHRPLRPAEHDLNVASAQVLGAICLAALAADGTTTVSLPGAVRDHTERLLAALGVDVSRRASGKGSTTVITGPVGLDSFELDVPGDFSSAAAWIVAASIHPDADVEMHGVGLNPTRVALIDVLRAMGADIETVVRSGQAGEPAGDIRVRSASRLRGVSLGASDVPPLIDELPLIAVAMAAAEGTSEVRGADELRVKESDRVATLAAALRAGGARVGELPDGWRIAAGRPRLARVTTHGDHRVAIAAAIAAFGGVSSGVELDDAACVAISYPTFWRDARALGGAAA